MVVRNVAWFLCVALHAHTALSWEEPAAQRPISREADERFWQSIAAQPPPETMSLRRLFIYLRTLAEERRHPERLERVLDLAAQAQDRDPASRTFGNFKWLWRDARVADPNAVEFLMQEAASAWIRHAEGMPAEARCKYRAILQRALEACLRHRVPITYTNIALLNAGNTAVLGEILDQPDAADEGYRRLEALCAWTWYFGIAEYCNPTYYGVDLDGLEFILSFARRERGRRQAAALRQLFWTDIAMNYFPAAEKLAGSHSRSYDYVRGLGSLDAHLAAAGWIRGAVRDRLNQWSAERPAGFAQLEQTARTRFPRIVRERWGMALRQSRTHALYPDVTLSSSASAYSSQDLPLTIDLAGDRERPRCYFIADGREDPYGKTRVEVGMARHWKAVHLSPFWAAAQRDRDAVALAIYRDGDVDPSEMKNLQSHLVLRRPEGGFWLGGRRIASLGTAPAREERPPGAAAPFAEQRIPVALGEPLVLRYGTAAVGIRILWARAQDGRPAAAAVVDDGNPFGVVRLTVEHRRDPIVAAAGTSLWLRVGSGLGDDNAFEAWRQRFERSAPWTVEASDSSVRIEAPGEEGKLRLAARAPFGRGGGVVLEPEPSRAILEVDGREVGRGILETIDPGLAELGRGAWLRPIEVPAEGRVAWEAEDGFVVHGMAVVDDAVASTGRCVVHPPPRPVARSPGSATWLLRVARPGRRYLWARVLAPNGETNSFELAVEGDTDQLLPPAAWHLRPKDAWNWQPWTRGEEGVASPLDLPAGLVWLQIRSREPGAKIDRFVVTTDPNERPE